MWLLWLLDMKIVNSGWYLWDTYISCEPVVNLTWFTSLKISLRNGTGIHIMHEGYIGILFKDLIRQVIYPTTAKQEDMCLICSLRRGQSSLRLHGHGTEVENHRLAKLVGNCDVRTTGCLGYCRQGPAESKWYTKQSEATMSKLTHSKYATGTEPVRVLFDFVTNVQQKGIDITNDLGKVYNIPPLSI